MRTVKVLTPAEAAMLVKDGDTVSTSGFVACGNPETLSKALETRFLETGSPKNLTYLYAAGQGNRDGSGADHFAHEGMIKRVIAGHYNMAPNLGKLIIANKVEAYNFPQGVLTHMFRDIASHKVATVTHVGLNTFADPRVEGGKLNDITKEDIVTVIDILGEERLAYKAQKIDAAFIRGTFADETGNVTLHKEVTPLDAISMAQAAKNSGGKVIVQVERVVKAGTLDPKLVMIPGIYVDAVVVSDPSEHEQCITRSYNPTFTGEASAPAGAVSAVPLSVKKIIGRRAAMELKKDKVVNLGIGVPEYVSMVANEEGIGDYMTLTVEAGPVGGIPMGGPEFGAAVNADCYLPQNYQFDFYDGGGIDLAYLGLAQLDESGNVNVSKFGPRIAGCGGFVNITQNAKKVFFCGTFTTSGLKTSIKDGKLVIDKEGTEIKFIKEVEQITFSGAYANKTKQPVMYITERAVFELRKDGVYLTEVAPGIDVKTQIIDLMGFEPKIDGEVKLMDARIFKDELMGLKD
ncbi:MAG: acyl CoA:acetate/3-ketoacid CoA transferase [Candidatus Metalachnospira sp.]|nr:acyl CoA:acetate/3-ketoacid CoA transferase [Candidatus Metalachnospira sp.]